MAKNPRPHNRIKIEKSTIKSGVRLYRIHPTIYGGNQFNDSATGDARFSPIKNRKTGVIIPTIYAGDSTEVAINEVVFHDVDTSSDKIIFDQNKLKDKSHTEIIMQSDIVVAVIDQVSVVKMRAGKFLLHGDAEHYNSTREWAEFIHDQHADIQGFEWPSRQYSGRAYVFFGDRVDSSLFATEKTDTLTNDKETRLKIIQLAQRMNITIE